MGKKKLNTIYGIATLDKGYYRIRTSNNGYEGKFLHRIIFEKYYNVKILPNVHIHHIDGDKTNNCILNLEAITKSKHHKLHSTNAEYSLEKRINIGKSSNKSGYFRVHKHKDNHCKQGFRYIYEWRVNNKRKTLSAVDIETLEKKVKEKGF